MSSYAPFATSLDGKAPITTVKGVAVNTPGIMATAIPLQSTFTKPQETRGCRDVFWGILFYVHLGGIIAAAIYTAPLALDEMMQAAANQEDNAGRRLLSRVTGGRFLEDAAVAATDDAVANTDIELDPNVMWAILAATGILGAIFSTLALTFMMAFAESLIKIALIFNIILFAVMALLSIATGALPTMLLCLLMSAFSAYYAYAVWSRIPFAAANLTTAVTAVRQNIGLALYAYWSLILLFLWSMLWTVASTCTIYILNECDAATGECNKDTNGGVMFLFILSFYWTAQVIANVVHVTTAGTVGTWWFQPEEAKGCCSQAVRESYIRSLTTSFGSICLGSLIVALIQTAREFLRSARENGDSVIACVGECLIGCLESLVEYFNKWAFVYVGLYGFSFMEAGQNVMSLFRSRGWTAIIADLMIDTVLNLVAMGVGLLMGIIVTALGAASGLRDAYLLIPFVVGGIIGYAMCSTLFSIVSSAVNTVIVCYAEAPNEFAVNHPRLSDNMRSSWRSAWPNEFNY